MINSYKNIIFSSERLHFREWNEADASFLFQLNDDPLVIKYTGDPPFNSKEDALHLIRSYTDYKKHGHGRWICELKETDMPIGWAGLKNQLADEGIIDIGYRFLKKHWNKGYGYEAAAGCLKYGFEQLKLEKITGRAAVENTHSHTILKRIGLKQEVEKRDCHGIKAVYYSLTKEEYEKLSY